MKKELERIYKLYDRIDECEEILELIKEEKVCCCTKGYDTLYKENVYHEIELPIKLKRYIVEHYENEKTKAESELQRYRINKENNLE